MPEDIETGNRQRNRNKNRKRKSGFVDDDVQPSTSRVIASCEDVVEMLNKVSISTNGSAVPADGQRKLTSKPEESRSDPVFNIKEAFDKEDEEDAEDAKNPKRVCKASAEDAFVDLEKYTGISLSQTDKSALCLRPKFVSGRGGEPVRLLTNFFRLKIRGNEVYQYDVVFLKSNEYNAFKEHEVGRRFKRLTKRMNQSLLATFATTTGSDLFRGKSYAYDNDRILITNKPLDAIPKDGEIFNFKFTEYENEEPRPQIIYIRIKPTVRLSLVFEQSVESRRNIGHNRQVLQVIDIIAKAHAFQHDIIYGSKIFLSAQAKRRIDMKIRDNPTPFELAFGYHQSTQCCQGGPMQNIDRATAVLYRGGPLIDRMVELIGTRFLSSDRIDVQDYDSLRDLYSLRFFTHYRGFPSCHIIRSITLTSCRETYFRDQDGRKCVLNYFFDHYAINLQYPNLPCVEYSNNKFIPIELCYIAPDQRNQRKLRDDLIRIVSTHSTAQKPYQRSADTVKIAETICNQRVLEQFGIQLIPTQVTVQSRLLMPPRLKYENIPDFSPRVPGDWNMTDKKFINPVALTRWALFAYQTRKISDKAATDFVHRLQRTGRMVGMNIENPLNPYRYITCNKLVEWFQQCATKNLQLIVIFMPENVEYYTLIKSLGDRKLGVPTQIIIDKHYDNRADRAEIRQKIYDPAFLCNLLLKINIKIGGTNLKLWDNNRCKVLNDKTMVVGVDVNHPSPNENAPSVAAVVGSIDPEFSNYRTEIQVNKSREELVRVDEMIVPILNAYKESRSCDPEHIIVYRDGVSEGQFAYVLGSEIFPLRKVLEKVCPRVPKLTYIVVQKRHNARFFPLDPKKATKSGNILPGSVIDTDICHYKWFDFYLCSQNSFLGTARPGKYTILWNSSPSLADDLQMATYYLCYLFARSTKSIADPAPARYAHHAAARGKVHLKEILRNDPNLLLPENAENLENRLNQALNVNNLKNILYFI